MGESSAYNELKEKEKGESRATGKGGSEYKVKNGRGTGKGGVKGKGTNS